MTKILYPAINSSYERPLFKQKPWNALTVTKRIYVNIHMILVVLVELYCRCVVTMQYFFRSVYSTHDLRAWKRNYIFFYCFCIYLCETNLICFRDIDLFRQLQCNDLGCNNVVLNLEVTLCFLRTPRFQRPRRASLGHVFNE